MLHSWILLNFRRNNVISIGKKHVFQAATAEKISVSCVLPSDWRPIDTGGFQW